MLTIFYPKLQFIVILKNDSRKFKLSNELIAHVIYLGGCLPPDPPGAVLNCTPVIPLRSIPSAQSQTALKYFFLHFTYYLNLNCYTYYITMFT